MKTRSKALLTVLCAMLLVVVSVCGTLAYLTSQDEVVNTFTVGDVEILLDEIDYDKETDTNDTDITEGTGNTDGQRDKANEYHLLPGHTYPKDPTVTVMKDSEDSYVRMLVTVKNIDNLKKALPQYDENQQAIGANAKYYAADGTFLLQMLCEGWDDDEWLFNNFKSEGSDGIYEFRYKEIVTKNENSDTKLDALFDAIVVPEEIDNDHMKFFVVENEKVEIVVTAHAIQSSGFEAESGLTAEEAAWNAFDVQNP